MKQRPPLGRRAYDAVIFGMDGVLSDDGGALAIRGSVELLHLLRERGISTAAVTFRSNGPHLLEAAAVTDLFDVRIDATQAIPTRLANKPAPDFFLEAAQQLQVAPERAVIVEDSEEGVRAAAKGGVRAGRWSRPHRLRRPAPRRRRRPGDLLFCGTRVERPRTRRTGLG